MELNKNKEFESIDKILSTEKDEIDHNFNFDQKLVAKINEEKLAPRPRWHFLLKNYVIWAVGILALLIGAASVSVMIYLLKYNDWEIYDQTKKSFGEYFLLTLPYFWFIFLVFFVYILYYNFKHTKRGYRYPVWLIAVISILFSFMLGAIFFVAGLGEEIDEVLGAQAPWYDKVINQQIPFWFNPGDGRLTGVIVDSQGQNDFTVIDPSGELWQINFPLDNFSNRPELIVGSPIHLIGQASADKHFSVKLSRSTHSGRAFFKRSGFHRRLRERCSGDSCSFLEAPVITPIK